MSLGITGVGVGRGVGVSARQEQEGLPARALGSVILPTKCSPLHSHTGQGEGTRLWYHILLSCWIHSYVLAMSPLKHCTNLFTSLPLHHLPLPSHLRRKTTIFDKAIFTVLIFLSIQSLLSFLRQDLCTCYFSETLPFPFLCLVSLYWPFRLKLNHH